MTEGAGKSMELDSLSTLNASLRQYADTRPWVMMTHRHFCTNCNSVTQGAARLMREERKDHYVRATGSPPPGVGIRNHEADAFFNKCEKCSGERPLKVSLQMAIEGAANDQELAQRAGHILADWMRRKRAQSPLSLEWEE